MNSSFIKNSAVYGSCFALHRNSTFYAIDSEFNENSADSGSIGYISGSTNQSVTLVNCTLSDNISKDGAYVFEEYPKTNKISINEW